MVYTTERRILCKKVYQRSSVVLQHEFKVKFYCSKGPRRLTVERSVKKFKQTGAVVDNKKAEVFEITQEHCTCKQNVYF
jgi:hypothetical protein